MSLTILIVQITWSSTDHAIPGTYKSLICINCEGRTNPSPELQRVQLQALLYRALVLVRISLYWKFKIWFWYWLRILSAKIVTGACFPLPCCFYVSSVTNEDSFVFYLDFTRSEACLSEQRSGPISLYALWMCAWQLLSHKRLTLTIALA